VAPPRYEGKRTAEILRLCYLQDDEIVSDAAVRRMLTELTAQLRDDEAL
jgi:hypothetical protein